MAEDAPAIATIWHLGWRDGHLGNVPERLLRDAGHTSAWLAVVADNTRARRLYERRGWRDQGLFDHVAPDGDRPIVVPAHRDVKDL